MEPLARGARFGVGAGAGPVPPSPHAAVQSTTSAMAPRTMLRVQGDWVTGACRERGRVGVAESTGSPAGDMCLPRFAIDEDARVYAPGTQSAIKRCKATSKLSSQPILPGIPPGHTGVRDRNHDHRREYERGRPAELDDPSSGSGGLPSNPASITHRRRLLFLLLFGWPRAVHPQRDPAEES